MQWAYSNADAFEESEFRRLYRVPVTQEVEVEVCSFCCVPLISRCLAGRSFRVWVGLVPIDV